MKRTVLALFLVLLPSLVEAQPPGQAPVQTPTQLQPASSTPSVMDRRWSIAVGFGWLGLEPRFETTPADAPGKVTFGVLDLAGRYRILPSIEISLGLTVGEALEGELGVGGLSFDFRYRFIPERPWNAYALLGLGPTTVANEGASDAERTGRPALRLGGGVERRFGVFGVHAELRLIAITDNDELETRTTAGGAWYFTRNALSGGSLTLGGALYF